ncbi:MAG: DUF1579 domain-containing protein [Vampirovibrionales bacterium]|nr:DUF1579 domain-containing protein [Vampirovibrionales bacterium]
MNTLQKSFAAFALTTAVAVLATPAFAESMPQKMMKKTAMSQAAQTQQPPEACPQPKATPAHAWLQQMVGEWQTQTKAYMGPNMPAQTATGTETVKPLGEFWTVSEVKSTMMDKPFSGMMTLGYDAKTNAYTGTWVDSMTGKLWQYQGAVDAAGKILTLESEGECPMRPGVMTRFKDVIEMKSPTEKQLTAYMLGEDGRWTMVMESTGQRIR